MADPTYFVRLFERRERGLAATPPIEAGDTIAAIGEALRRAQEAAGAIAYACSGEDTGDCAGVQIIIRIGDAPDGYWPC